MTGLSGLWGVSGQFSQFVSAVALVLISTALGGGTIPQARADGYLIDVIDYQKVVTVASDAESFQGRVLELSVAQNARGEFIGVHVTSGGDEWYYANDQLEQTVAVVTRDAGFFSKDVVLLTAADVRPDSSARIFVTVLREYAIFGSDDYRYFEMQLFKRDDGKWALATTRASDRASVPVNDLYFQVYRPSGDEVGIGRVIFKYDGQVMDERDTGSLLQP